MTAVETCVRASIALKAIRIVSVQFPDMTLSQASETLDKIIWHANSCEIDRTTIDHAAETITDLPSVRATLPPWR